MTNTRLAAVMVVLLVVAVGGALHAQPGPNLLPDPSIEQTRQKNQFGIPYAVWGGYIFEGSPELRNARIARTGETCAEIVGAQGGKVRVYSPSVQVEPGRYRFSCYVRGLDIGDEAKARLVELTPAGYAGLASGLVDYAAPR